MTITRPKIIFGLGTLIIVIFTDWVLYILYKDQSYITTSRSFQFSAFASSTNFKTRCIPELNVYVSSNDRALLISRFVNRARRHGESIFRVDQLEEAVVIADLLSSEDDLINMIDVTPINRTRSFNSFSLETPEFFDDLYLRLTNVPTPHNCLLYKTQTPDGSIFWVLTRGR